MMPCPEVGAGCDSRFWNRSCTALLMTSEFYFASFPVCILCVIFYKNISRTSAVSFSLGFFDISLAKRCNFLLLYKYVRCYWHEHYF